MVGSIFSSTHSVTVARALLATAICAALLSGAASPSQSNVPGPEPVVNLPYIPGQSILPLLQARIKECWSSQLKTWAASQVQGPDAWAIARKGNEFVEACRRATHVPDGTPRRTNPIGLCEGDNIATMPPIDQQPLGYSTDPEITNGNGAVGGDSDNIPQACQTISGSTKVATNWIRMHLRGGNYGNLPDPMFDALRPEHGHVVMFGSQLSRETPRTEMTIDEQLRQMTIPRPQSEAPSQLVALMHKQGKAYKLLPLNYSAGNPSRVDVPWAPAQLSALYDNHTAKYLLYMPSVSFLTPPWDSSIPSWEDFYVWWLDIKSDSIERQLLPAGPWVADAKRDRELGRDDKNFPCGTGCYRDYKLMVDSGNIFVTISGRPSAVNEGVVGVYRFAPGSTKWVKIK